MGGLRPPAPRCFSGGLRPGPPKRRSAPLVAAVVRFLATEPLVRGRTFPRNLTFFEEATCPGQLRCLGQHLFSKNCFFLRTSHLSRAASLPGAELFPEHQFCFSKSHLSRAALLPGAELFSKQNFFNKQLVPGSYVAWGRTLSQKNDFAC